MFKSLADPEYHFCQIIPRDTTTQEAGAVMEALAFHQSVPRSFSGSTPLWDKLRFPTLLRQLFFSVAQTSSQQNNNSTKERPLSLPLLDSFCFQDLCKLVKMPEANSDLICLAWIINSHLSFSIHKGHLNSRKKIVIPRKTSF